VECSRRREAWCTCMAYMVYMLDNGHVYGIHAWCIAWRIMGMAYMHGIMGHGVFPWIRAW
jgi:hypothetical protein